MGKKYFSLQNLKMYTPIERSRWADYKYIIVDSFMTLKYFLVDKLTNAIKNLAHLSTIEKKVGKWLLT